MLPSSFQPCLSFSFSYILQNNQLQDVAVKILMEQDFHAERFQEFLREVCFTS